MRYATAVLGAAAYVAALIASGISLQGYEACSAAVVGAMVGYFIGWGIEGAVRAAKGGASM